MFALQILCMGPLFTDKQEIGVGKIFYLHVWESERLSEAVGLVLAILLSVVVHPLGLAVSKIVVGVLDRVSNIGWRWLVSGMVQRWIVDYTRTIKLLVLLVIEVFGGVWFQGWVTRVEHGAPTQNYNAYTLSLVYAARARTTTPAAVEIKADLPSTKFLACSLTAGLSKWWISNTLWVGSHKVARDCPQVELANLCLTDCSVEITTARWFSTTHSLEETRLQP